MILIITYILGAELKAAPRETWKGMAEHIASLDGLRWKYWLRSTDDDYYGGVYLFDTPEQAKAGGTHLQGSLVEAGASDISLRFYEVDAELSALTRGLMP